MSKTHTKRDFGTVEKMHMKFKDLNKRMSSEIYLERSAVVVAVTCDLDGEAANEAVECEGLRGEASAVVEGVSAAQVGPIDRRERSVNRMPRAILGD